MVDDRAVVYQPDAAPGSLVTEDMQIEWRGMLMGPGSWCGYKSLSGWDDLAPVDASYAPIPQQHGSFPGRALMGEKVITFQSQLFPPNEGEWRKLYRAIQEITTVREDENQLSIRQHGQTLVGFAKITGRILPIDRAYFNFHPLLTLQWTMSDPRRYGSELKTVVAVPAVDVGGLPWDDGLGWSPDGLEWGSIPASSRPVVENRGAAETFPVIEFRGPLAPGFFLRTPKWNLGFNIRLYAGETITVDTRTGRAYKDGSPALFDLHSRSDIPEDCFFLPGDQPVWLDPANEIDDTGTATIKWRDAYH